MAEWRQQMRKDVFVSCWHRNETESDAMWRIYSGSNQGIALQTTYERLDASLRADLLLGDVCYRDFRADDDVSAFGNTLSPFMQKRAVFASEREVRVLLWRYHTALMHRKALVRDDADAIYVPWELEQVTDQLVVSPYAADWYLDVVLSVVKNLAPKLSDRISWSGIKGVPLF